jgi:hypothetical protein
MGSNKKRFPIYRIKFPAPGTHIYMNTLTTIQSPNFILGNNYLEINGDPSNEEYRNAFEKLTEYKECTNWWIGDLLLHLEANDKDILITLGDKVGLNFKTLQNLKSLCKKIPKQLRVEGVSFQHHIYAWSETKNEGLMVEELKIAKTNNYSSQQMRTNIREKLSNHDKTVIPDIIRSKHDISLTEAMNGILAIKRFINNAYSKVNDVERADFYNQFNDLADLVEGSIK